MTGRTCCCCWATRSTRTRCRRRRRVRPPAPRHEQGPAREVLDFEEYTHLYSRGVGRAHDPVAALHGLDGDDLRRPRRSRRLEHVGRVGRGGARAPIGGTSTSRRPDVVLDLPAHRQPQPGRARGGRSPRSGYTEAKDAGPVLREFAFHADREVEGQPLELLPRPGRHQAAGVRLPLRPRARGGSALDARRRGVAVGGGARRAGTSSTLHRHIAALAAGAGHALPRGLERACLRRGVGVARRPRGREAAAGTRPGALGGVQRLLRPPGRAAARGGRGRRGGAPPASIVMLVGRRASRLPERGGLPPRLGSAQRGLPGHLLAPAQPARTPRSGG